MTTPVTPARANEIIAAYGAEPRRWPAAERDGVLTLVASDAAVARTLADARALDVLIDAAPPPPQVAVNPVAIAAAARRDGVGASAAPRLRWRIAGMAAAAMLGFVVGLSGLAPLRAIPDREDPATAFAAMIEEDAL